MIEEGERLRQASERVVALARDVKVLSRLAWPEGLQAEFLAAWPHGKSKLPQVDYDRRALEGRAAELEACVSKLDPGHPLEGFVRNTALSYAQACNLLENAGTARAGELSRLVYGQPGDPVAGGQVTNLDAARHFLGVCAEIHAPVAGKESDYCLSAAVVRDQMAARVGAVIPDTAIEIKVDSGLAAKAAAGATRVRLRDAVCFSEYDVEQLLQHEVFVHSLTALNGRAQPWLTCLTLGAPRTTATQEGLATFAELVTGAIDLARLERISLRIIAIDMVLSGANFIDLFRFFIDAGQPPSESFNSSMRVFRGMPTAGGAAFTKDAVYLHGLLEVHTFFRWALAHNRLPLCWHLFAGRLCVEDLMGLEPYFDQGLLAAPRYLPPWMRNAAGLAAYLAFSVFSNRISIEALGADHLQPATETSD